MELFLNLCWLALLLPAYALWRQRVSSAHAARSSFVVIGTLGCAFVLLFPVVSASDDIQAIGQTMEESERAFRQDDNRASAVHALAHAAPVLALTSAAFKITLERSGSVPLFSTHSPETVFASASAGRAPPARPVLL